MADLAATASGYADDILIGTRRHKPTESTNDLMLKHEREVSLVMEQNLKLRLVASYNKCKFFRAIVDFCRHMVSGGAVRNPGPGKLLAVERYVQRLSIPYGGSCGSQTTTLPTSGGMRGSWFHYKTY